MHMRIRDKFINSFLIYTKIKINTKQINEEKYQINEEGSNFIMD